MWYSEFNKTKHKIMIKIKDVNFNYGLKTKVFEKLNLEIPTDSICGILGENGVGKTTLLNLIVGAIFPKSGTISVFDYESKRRKAEMLREMYYITDEFRLPALKIDRFVDAYSVFYPKFSREAMDKYIDLFKLDRDKRIDKFSLGQRKKVLLAFGFAAGVKLLILDEPTNGLDIPSQSVFRSMLAELAAQGRGAIISTHQIRDTEQLLDRVVILTNEELILNASTDEICDKFTFTNKQNTSSPIFEQGLKAIVENTTGEPSNINIELLFNAAIAHPELIKNIILKS